MRAIGGKSIATAVSWLRAGEPVALPTETVYGLAAPLSSLSTIEKVYALKQRPKNNPLIVHVLDTLQLKDVAEITPFVVHLVEHFWPGPLTLVLKRKSCVSDIVTAGQDTVAVRSPRAQLFRDIIQMLGEPLVAPSANKFQHISPTTAQHVLNDMGDGLAYILDGGPCTFGLESTILSLVDERSPKILRYGPISKEELEQFLGREIAAYKKEADDKMPHLSPGLFRKHYSPSTPLYLVPRLEDYKPTQELEPVFSEQSAHVFLFCPRRSLEPNEFILSQHGDLYEVAANLLALLQELDGRSYSSIWIEKAPDGGLGDAINDRLSRAAHYKLFTK